MRHAFIVYIDTDDDNEGPIRGAQKIAEAILDAANTAKDLNRVADAEVQYLGFN